MIMMLLIKATVILNTGDGMKWSMNDKNMGDKMDVWIAVKNK